MRGTNSAFSDQHRLMLLSRAMYESTNSAFLIKYPASLYSFGKRSPLERAHSSSPSTPLYHRVLFREVSVMRSGPSRPGVLPSSVRTSLCTSSGYRGGGPPARRADQDRGDCVPAAQKESRIARMGACFCWTLGLNIVQDP
jgi:hypothetical protein